MDRRWRRAASASAALALFLASASGCLPDRSNDAYRRTAGQFCTQQNECAAGLVCAANGLCATVGSPGSAASGQPCGETSDCQQSLFCSDRGFCVQPGIGAIDAECQGNEACRRGLVCARPALCAEPNAPGTKQLGDSCGGDEDCGFGLACGAEARCERPTAWTGAECDAPSEIGGPPRVLFEVPRAGVPTDFFRLPYPNDIRARDGVLALDSFPAPPRLSSDERDDIVARFAAATTDDVRGFGLNAGIVFRFSTNVDFGSLVFGGDDATLLFVNITPESPNKGRRPRSRFFATTNRSQYVCHNWLGIRPSEGTPLEPNNTYAVLFLRGIVDTRGTRLEADRDFVEVLGENEPEHPALEAAWRAHSPLRAWLREEGIVADRVIGGTVFTTGDPAARADKLRESVRGVELMPLSELVVCDGQTVSPCQADAPRICGEPNESFVELHGRVNLPVFQRGTAPYADRGGDFSYDELGRPVPQGLVSTCVAVTVPKREPDAGGWPVVLYAHGVEGSFRSSIVDGVAARLARLGYATVSYDGVLHGPRVGGAVPSGESTASLIDNLSNPAAMRDHVLQGAADLFAMTRIVEQTDTMADGVPVVFDTGRLGFFGHGFGGRVGAIFVAHEPEIGAAVFASTGGSVGDMLLGQTAPRNLSAVVRVGLADADLNGLHPAIGLLQTFLDSADPVNYVGRLRNPPSGFGAKHVFQLYGVGDEVTPPASMAAFAVSAHLARVGPEAEKMDSVPAADAAVVRGNVEVRSTRVTMGVRQYVPSAGEPGHRVAFENGTATRDLERFFSSWLEDPEGVPTIGSED